MDNGALDLHYQPQVDLNDGHVAGAEALSRWNDPVRGSVPADAFIDVAEQGGLIVDHGRWATETACRDVAAWQAQGLPGFRVAVSVSVGAMHALANLACS